MRVPIVKRLGSVLVGFDQMYGRIKIVPPTVGCPLVYEPETDTFLFDSGSWSSRVTHEALKDVLGIPSGSWITAVKVEQFGYRVYIRGENMPLDANALGGHLFYATPEGEAVYRSPYNLDGTLAKARDAEE